MAAVSKYFPYPEIRVHQDRLMDFIGEGLESKSHMVLEGATGLGKTIAILANLIPYAIQYNKKIIYLTRTHRQMDRVIEEILEINKKSKASAVALRGKRDMCLNNVIQKHTESSVAVNEVCGYLRKNKMCQFYQNLKDYEEISELLEKLKSNPLKSTELLTLASELDVCPYYLVSELLEHVNLITCSYLYMVSPSIRDNFLKKLNSDYEDLIIVFDEAHNLPDIATSVASDTISTHALNGVVREADHYNIKIAKKFVSFIIEDMDTLSDQMTEDELLLSSYALKSLINNEIIEKKDEYLDIRDLLYELKNYGEKIREERIKDGKAPRSYIYHLATFFLNWLETSLEDDYTRILRKAHSKHGKAYYSLDLIALDPRRTLKEVLDNVHLSIHMSGTIGRLDAFRETIGLPQTTKMDSFDSPFLEKNIAVFVVEGITTKGTFRSPIMYDKIVAKISEVVNNTPQNVGIFTASYEVLDGLRASNLEYALSKELYIESADMISEEHETLIQDFKRASQRDGAVLLGPQGGRSAEGSDFPGGEMNTVIVVGVPYAKKTATVLEQIEYYKKQFPKNGLFYGYYLPAFRKLSQAAGRAHRDLDDKAAIVFLDWRISDHFVKKNLTHWIKNKIEIIKDRKNELAKNVASFFSRTPTLT